MAEKKPVGRCLENVYRDATAERSRNMTNDCNSLQFFLTSVVNAQGLLT
jgi:hypothetical protein